MKKREEINKKGKKEKPSLILKILNMKKLPRLPALALFIILIFISLMLLVYGLRTIVNLNFVKEPFFSVGWILGCILVIYLLIESYKYLWSCIKEIKVGK